MPHRSARDLKKISEIRRLQRDVQAQTLAEATRKLTSWRSEQTEQERRDAEADADWTRAISAGLDPAALTAWSDLALRSRRLGDEIETSVREAAEHHRAATETLGLAKGRAQLMADLAAKAAKHERRRRDERHLAQAEDRRGREPIHAD